MKMRIGGVLAVAVLASAGGMGGCNRSGSGGQAAETPSPSVSSGATPSTDASPADGGGSGGYAEAADRPPVPMFHGEPMWSENRRHTAKENAEYHFERAGQDLGAKTLDDFLTKVHRFGDHPPAGALKLSRPNGDRLIYDPKSNLFAVFTRDGAPRTVFKPANGMDYWTEQKARLAEGDSGYGRSYGGSSGRSGGDYGSEQGGGGGTRGDEGN